MRNFKTVLFILGLLSSSVTMSADNSVSNEDGKASLIGATFMARVTAQKAVVYSDENMLSPLGYIANSKAILVGNPRRMNRDLVPTVINGRLAFIEIKDIRYEDTSDEEYNMKRGAPREHNFDIILEKPEEKLSANNSLYFSINSFNAGDEFKNTTEEISNGEENNAAMLGFNLQLIHRQAMTRWFWGAAFEYSSITNTYFKFGYWMFSPTFGVTPIKNPLFLVDVYGSYDFALNTQLTLINAYEAPNSGGAWGPQINARIVFFPEAKYHLYAGAGYKHYNIKGMDELRDINGSYTGFTHLRGPGVFAGFAMEFF